MRVLLIDIDTLRPDHLGCYGYKRDTSPCIDSIAKEGILFEKYYTPNAPCLPSRASLVTGLYGIHNGILGHGGTAGDLHLEGEPRDFRDELSMNNLFMTFRKAGYYTVSFSTFAERHSAWWFNSGFNEMYNVGKGGHESAEEVTPLALKWLEEKGESDNWFMHYHLWDPHTPYRAPEEFGNPFKDQPLSDDWITEDIFKEHLKHVGPHGAKEIGMWDSDTNPKYPRHPGELVNMDEVKDFIDQYDCGVRYTDDNIKQLIDLLKEKGVYEDTAIIITSDHGENIGELGIYGEHATADEPCCHVPMIIKWPGYEGEYRDDKFHTNVDLAPTMADMLNIEPFKKWDGMSYAKTITEKKDCGYDDLVLTQCAHVCQRSARFDDYIYIRTVHGGYHLFDDEMLFNIKEDPHQTNNLAKSYPELCAKGAKIILDWEYDMMKSSSTNVDPMWTVMREGGPLHSRGELTSYVERLKQTDRGEFVEELLEKYPNERYQ
jgi:arylsulfatase A-like enzyme